MPFPMQDRRPFTQAGIELLASIRPGIYGIFDDSVCIYIGSAGDVRTQLLKHFRNATAEAQRIWQNRPTYFQVSLNPSSGLARALADLINEYRPIAQQ